MPEALYAPLQEQVRELEDVLHRAGFVRCDLAACNCGSWHHRFGLPQRMDEIKDALSEAGHPLSNENGNLVLNALKALIAERDSLADATCSLRGADEARQFPDNTCPASRHAQMIGEALVKGEAFPQLSEEPAHCGQSILATVEALYRARTALRGGQQGWQDIDSAPMDGSHILLYRPHITFVGFYAPNGKCWVHNAPGLPLINPEPALWMPLPAHPAPPPSTHPQETQP